ncbi:hypothetical protein HCU01_14020 [Halomonas cupida]|uniref:Cell division protein ZipA n=1 Tax=Halomonas cupida TaxID=44933 RepID=A0A1M7F8N2_9GAMM|nr:cell division protein ZipA C-terminal FtsZ-binding domain-containing protein [Halomonas cupida]GEN23453.1 hypothetical protein HCU01_14020 [Halomonas cupida]SHM00432.1 cell division protein ZipA [Halomonas cupida]
MELREWLIILGLALVTLIVIDGVRRLQRQRRTPRLDEVAGEGLQTASADGPDPEAEARAVEVDWELPNGGARVVRPADFSSVQPKPKLERQEHPGPSRVLHEFRASQQRNGQDGVDTKTAASSAAASAVSTSEAAGAAVGQAESDNLANAGLPDSNDDRAEASAQQEAKVDLPEQSRPDSSVRADSVRTDTTADRSATPSTASVSDRVESDGVKEQPFSEDQTAAGADTPQRREPVLSATDDDERETTLSAEPLSADPEDHDEYDEEHYRLVDFEGMGDSLKTRSRQVGSSMQRFGASLQKSLADRREHKRVERERRERLKAEKAAEAARLAEQKAAEQQAARAAAEAEQARLELERQQQAQLQAQSQSLGTTAYAEDDDPLFAPRRAGPRYDAEPSVSDEFVAEESVADEPLSEAEEAQIAAAMEDSKVRVHPVLEKALRHDVNAEHARDSLANADEIIVISVMSRDPAGFHGSRLLELMMACGLRYSREMGIFHRFETEDADSALQFSMVNVLKPGSFPIEAMDDFTSPGVTLLMPLPGANDTSAAFEAMVETAMVIVRHLGGELKDENRSVMTAQTVEFARQRVQEFERRHRLHRYQVN